MKKALCCGLNRVSPENYGGWSGYLSGCWADCEKTADALAIAGYESRGLFDEDCTVDRIRNEFVEASASLVDGDIFIYSNSGHGSQNPGGLYGTEEGLVLYDGILVDSEFRFLLSRFRPGVDVIAILDVCHAAGLSRAMPAVRARVAPLFVTRGMSGPSKPRADVNANCIIMASCAPDELSGDTDDGGAFTKSMLSVLTEDMAWGVLMAATKRFMSSRYATQHPELVHIGGAGLEDRLI